MTPFIEPEARADILRQVERYAGQGLPPIARRFHRGVLASLDALIAKPESGPERLTGDPSLTGLRAWPVKGFDAFLLAAAIILVGASLRIVSGYLPGRRG